MSKPPDAESILGDAYKFFAQSETSIDLFTASILKSVLACHKSGKMGYEDIKRIAEFTSSVSREAILRIKKELLP